VVVEEQEKDSEAQGQLYQCIRNVVLGCLNRMSRLFAPKIGIGSGKWRGERSSKVDMNAVCL